MSDLQFAPQKSKVDPAAWNVIGQRKLNDLKLSHGPLTFRGTTGAATVHRGTCTSAPVTITPDDVHDANYSVSQEAEPKIGLTSSIPVQCTAFLLNTLDEFKTIDRTNLMHQEGCRIWQAITSGTALAQPSLLTRALLLVHADLKKYIYTHLFAFITFKIPVPYYLPSPPVPLTTLPPLLIDSITTAVTHSTLQGSKWPCVITVPVDQAGDTQQVQEHVLSLDDLPKRSGDKMAVWPADVIVVVPDSSEYQGVVGFLGRNVLALLTAHFGGSVVRMLSVKQSGGCIDKEHSFLISVQLPNIGGGWGLDGSPCPDVVGWEKDTKGRVALKQVSLSEALDPVLQASQALSLNLKLMKWRAAPSLDITAISSLNCLILGAGTLGCEVARTLMAWGVTKLHFVDNGRVAFSNPARQSLYQFEDCLDGGKWKAEAAASAVRRINPSVVAHSSCISIAMPGHPPAPAEMNDSEHAVAKLDTLVRESDVVFLLTDSREARWLPTVMAAAHNKLLINVALGFDGWVVMRHGPAPESSVSSRLGCYFCNDVVAPLNSAIGRTLDEQCTVARPGLARMAGAVAVEMLAALQQHVTGVETPASDDSAPNTSAALGSVPHMIRGQLTGFSQMHMIGCAHNLCTACSGTVIDAYRSQGWNFVLSVLQNPSHLEKLTGLDAMQEAALAAEKAMNAALIDQESGDKGEARSDDEDWLEL